jgi:hypothetical protein
MGSKVRNERFVDEIKGVAYYWAIPTWAKNAGCNVKPEALGQDYGAAKKRCDEVLNPQFDAWRGRETPTEKQSALQVGTFDWMVSSFKKSPQYTGKSAEYRKYQDRMLKIASAHPLKDGRRFGDLKLPSIKPGTADALFDRIKTNADGSERTRTAKGVMVAARRAWGVAYRSTPNLVPAENPFTKMEISYTPKRTRPVKYEELKAFVKAADELKMPSIGTAAMIAFHWLQRQVDILTRFSWSHYKPADAPECVRIFHHKTKVLHDLPLFDDDGSPLYPELTARLDSTPRNGLLIVTRDEPDRNRKIFLPWKQDYFRHCIAEVREKAGLDSTITFMGVRHGGNVEGANAGLTEAQLRSLSGHKNAGTMIRYAQETPDQQREGARKRLALRTKKGNLSE